MHSPLTPLISLTTAQADGATTTFGIDCNTNNVSGGNCQGTAVSYNNQICSGCSGSLGVSSYTPSEINAMGGARNIGPLDLQCNEAKILGQVVFRRVGLCRLRLMARMEAVLRSVR